MKCISAMVCAAVLALSGCQREEADPLKVAVEEGRQKEAERVQGDPNLKTHDDDRNPLRRKLSDQQIRELFFGPDQIDGDWVAWLPCSQQHAGLEVHPGAKAHLSRCGALAAELLKRAHSAGFKDATVDDVLDPQLTNAKASQ